MQQKVYTWIQLPCLDAKRESGKPRQSASGGNHGKARVGGTPKTALPPREATA
ncbi:hypothetical protein [Moorena sp. SIO3F7]|uniref:hypothetical protein n=1 Tax=Moorena sp. SIO3F7 TaxID=2607839 RepID=UPI0013FEC3FD|nr:hypothetical protein [Moorena sp. SIO3F7]NEO13637.1 hypothetical protein [Moorena sp. SIO3E8]NEQ00061.1 hypothetical protein [Moorena sp. SIO3F7]